MGVADKLQKVRSLDELATETTALTEGLTGIVEEIRGGADAQRDAVKEIRAAVGEICDAAAKIRNAASLERALAWTAAAGVSVVLLVVILYGVFGLDVGRTSEMQAKCERYDRMQARFQQLSAEERAVVEAVLQGTYKAQEGVKGGK